MTNKTAPAALGEDLLERAREIAGAANGFSDLPLYRRGERDRSLEVRSALAALKWAAFSPPSSPLSGDGELREALEAVDWDFIEGCVTDSLTVRGQFKIATVQPLRDAIDAIAALKEKVSIPSHDGAA